MRSVLWTVARWRLVSCRFPVGSDRDNYQAAFELLKEQRYEQAGMAFQQFLVAFRTASWPTTRSTGWRSPITSPTSSRKALGEFEAVVNDYPQSRKVPDALLKMGYCSYELERYDADARAALVRVQASTRTPPPRTPGDPAPETRMETKGRQSG